MGRQGQESVNLWEGPPRAQQGTMQRPGQSTLAVLAGEPGLDRHYRSMREVAAARQSRGLPAIFSAAPSDSSWQAPLRVRAHITLVQ